MRVRFRQLVVTAAVAACAAVSVTSDAAAGQGRGRGAAGVEQRRGRGESVRRTLAGRQRPRAYQEPAFARGYSIGYDRGLADGLRRARYDPVDNREYRSGDEGYSASYGSKDAYRNNYRAGFRQGYEDGYRAGTR